jgi:hypothetical protein
MTLNPLHDPPIEVDCVNVGDDWEAEYWMVTFGCTRRELEVAVAAVGCMASDVESYLRRIKALRGIRAQPGVRNAGRSHIRACRLPSNIEPHLASKLKPRKSAHAMGLVQVIWLNILCVLLSGLAQSGVKINSGPITELDGV